MAGFYNSLLDFLAQMKARRFIKPQHFEMLLVDDNLERLLDRFAEFEPLVSEKWMDRDQALRP